MILARTFDAKRITEIINDPSISDLLCDDNTQNTVIEYCSGQYWIGVFDDDNVMQGAFLLIPQNSVTVDIHTCLLPVLHGNQAIQAGRMLLNIVFASYQKAVTSVPVNNRRASLFAARLGFKTEGVNRQSFLKHGQLLDQKVMGLTLGEYVCQQQPLQGQEL